MVLNHTIMYDLLEVPASSEMVKYDYFEMKGLWTLVLSSTEVYILYLTYKGTDYCHDWRKAAARHLHEIESET